MEPNTIEAVYCLQKIIYRRILNLEISQKEIKEEMANIKRMKWQTGETAEEDPILILLLISNDRRCVVSISIFLTIINYLYSIKFF